MHDRPTAPELLDAVAGWLREDLAPAAPRELQFHLAIAANVCRVVARELAAGPEDDAADAELFGRLLGERDGDAAELRGRLAERVRDGAFDDDLVGLARALHEHVARKVAIVRPGYDAG